MKIISKQRSTFYALFERFLMVCNEKFLGKIKIRNTLMISFILLSVVPLLAIGFGSFMQTENSIVELGKNSSVQAVKQLRQSLGLAMTKIEGELWILSQNQNIFKYIDECNNTIDLDKSEVFRLKSILQTNMGNSFAANKDVIGGELCLYAIEGTEHTKSFEFNGRSFYPPNKEDSSLVALIGDNYADTYWTYFNKSENPDVNARVAGINAITATKPIIDLKYGTDILGYVTIALKDSFFFNIYKEVKLAEGSYILLLDKKGKLVSGLDPNQSENTLLIGQSFVNGVKLIEKINGMDKLIEANPSIQPVFEIELDGKKMLAAYETHQDTGWQIVSLLPVSSILDSAEKIKVFTGVSIVTGIILAALISLVISSAISFPLQKTMESMKMAENGDLTVEVALNQSDEVGQLIKSFNQMISNIHVFITNINTVSEKVFSTSELINLSVNQTVKASEQVSWAVQEIAEGATTQAQETEEGVNAINSLAEGITSVSDNMKVVVGVVSDVKERGLQAACSLNNLKEIAAETSFIAKEIINEIYELNQSMKEISKIIKLIANISEQTNLLALNASIEAARAGKAGRGFSVVAEQIKKLADETKESTAVISGLISNINQKTGKALTVAEKATMIVHTQLDAVKHSENDINQIMDSLSRVSEEISNTNNSVKDIDMHKGNVVFVIQNISGVAQQVAATTQEVLSISQIQIEQQNKIKSMADDLNVIVNELNVKMAKFKISKQNE